MLSDTGNRAGAFEDGAEKTEQQRRMEQFERDMEKLPQRPEEERNIHQHERSGQ